MTHRIVTEEEQLLGQVRRLLEEEPWVTPPSEADIVAELVRLRDEIRTAKVEDRPALMLQYNQQHSLLEQIRASRDAPQVDPDSPYFAHLRLEEEGRTRDVCIGKATRIQRGVRIVDWRNAPVSRLFYRYQQGEEYEEEMGGRVLSGQVLARRTVTIRKGELQRVDAPEGAFVREGDEWRQLEILPPRLGGGEGLALRAHRPGEGSGRRLGTAGAKHRVDKHLPDIAGLLDPEQFELITQPSSGFVVIRGTAGSGKTTVALHRIAWLAFQDQAINSRRTLFVVFSRALREYVSHVLPALGVPRASIQTFHHWASRARKRHFPKLPDRHRQDTPADVVRLKLHPALLNALERQVSRVKAPGTPEQAVDDWASALTDRALLEDVLSEFAPGAFTEDQLSRIVTWCRDRTDEVVAWMDGDREVDAALDSEDDALLLRAWQLRVGPLLAPGKGARPLRYRHVAIDEVQDFSPLEVRVLLGCLDRRQSITLAGDTQQHVMQEAGFTSWTDFFNHLGLEGVSVNTLRVAYRSTAQIVHFARELLGDLREDDDPPLVTRTGPEVELFRFTDHGAAVAFLADALKELVRQEPHASIALLTPDPSVSRSYLQGLRHSEVPRLRQVTDQDFTFAPGVEITEVSQVKGLEFDYVVLIETNAAWYPDTPAARRLLHVGATRAVHQLWLTSVGTPSPVVRGVLGEEGG